MSDFGDQASSSDPRQVAAEINALHDEVLRNCHTSEGQIHSALAAAWRAGHLLAAAKEDVRSRMGHGAWYDWLRSNFSGSARTAQRYMQMAKSVTAVTDLKGLSLRQAYQRLGMRVEEHGVAEDIKPPAPLGPGRSIRRLLVKLPSVGEFMQLATAERERLLSDLSPLRRRIDELFADT